MQVAIDSRAHWVDTGVLIVAGATYELRATGTWRDASIDTDASGYASANIFQRLTERLRRMPDAPWFALIGAIDRREDTQFVIGTASRFRATASGQLTCFANDLRGFYFNNSGNVILTVEQELDPVASGKNE
jgi:hypothetical protein